MPHVLIQYHETFGRVSKTMLLNGVKNVVRNQAPAELATSDAVQQEEATYLEARQVRYLRQVREVREANFRRFPDVETHLRNPPSPRELLQASQKG